MNQVADLQAGQLAPAQSAQAKDQYQLGVSAGELANDWVRIDVWTDNTGLHRYYEEQGFRHVRPLDLTDYPPRALFQRKAPDRRKVRTDSVITERTHDLPMRRDQSGPLARLIRPVWARSLA